MLPSCLQCLSRGLFAAALLLATLLSACGSDSSDEDYRLIPLQTLLPAATRGFFQLSEAQTSGSATLDALLADTKSAWRNHPLDILRHYSSGIPLAQVAQEILLAQVSGGGDEFLLLLHVDSAQANATLANLALGEAAAHAGQAIGINPANGLSLAALSRSTWVIGQRASVEAAIDVFRAAAPGLAESALAPYLGSPVPAHSLYFAYGLPALTADAANPGSGEYSLNQALAIHGNLDVGGTLDGALEIATPNAQPYTERLRALVPETVAGRFEATADALRVDVTGLSADEDLRSLVKSLVIGMNAVDYTAAVRQGGNAPWLNFNVGDEPNSIFINFEFLDAARRSDFEARHLPAGFTLAPLRILETDPPRYYLVLNIYQSSGGLVEGARAEWSVFVNDPQSGQPRFLVIQAAAESISADSVNLLTFPEPVSHARIPNGIASYVGVVDETSGSESLYFSSHIQWPQPEGIRARFTREFVVANDFIFWGNAVADRGLYNATVYNRDAVRIADEAIALQDSSRWAEFIGAKPVHTVLYLNPLEIVISPWWNLDAPYLDVSDDYRQELITFKNNFYPGTVQGVAAAAMRGNANALAPQVAGEPVSTSYFHFVLHDVFALLASLGIAGEVMPAAIALNDGEDPQHYLTLAISGRTPDPCGLRADWITYTQDAQGRPGTLLLESLRSEACVHPVSLLGVPASIGQSEQNATLHVNLVSAFTRFEAELDMQRSQPVLPSLDWLESGDHVCALNGVCDALFYDGALLSQPLQRVDAQGITVTALATPWNAFMSMEPSQASVRAEPAIMAVNPWGNVVPFGVSKP